MNPSYPAPATVQAPAPAPVASPIDEAAAYFRVFAWVLAAGFFLIAYRSHKGR